MQNFRLPLESYLASEADPIHKCGHQPRLYSLTRQIAARIHPTPVYDDDVVFAAAYLHDLGVFIGHRPADPGALANWDHVEYVCNLAPGLLTSFDFPANKVQAVLACMREHQPKDTPKTFEATLLRDADILEQLGAIGILRTASKLGSDTRFHTFEDARSSLRRSLDTLPALILLHSTRELAIPRIQALREFLIALGNEAGDYLY